MDCFPGAAVLSEGILRTLQAQYVRSAEDTITRYYADARVNGLHCDRHSEEEAVHAFAGGLRMIDISNPYRPEELGYYIPEPGDGKAVPQSNDVFCIDDHIYLIVDRLGGFDIVEWVGT